MTLCIEIFPFVSSMYKNTVNAQCNFVKSTETEPSEWNTTKPIWYLAAMSPTRSIPPGYVKFGDFFCSSSTILLMSFSNTCAVISSCPIWWATASNTEEVEPSLRLQYISNESRSLLSAFGIRIVRNGFLGSNWAMLRYDSNRIEYTKFLSTGTLLFLVECLFIILTKMFSTTISPGPYE